MFRSVRLGGVRLLRGGQGACVCVYLCVGLLLLLLADERLQRLHCVGQ